MFLEVANEVVEQTNDIWQTIKDQLNVPTITSITAIILLLVACLKLVSCVKTLNKQKAMTIPNLLKELKAYVDKIKDNEVKQWILEFISPLESKVDKLVPVIDVLVKIIALAQENTPDSKIAILNLIQELGSVETKQIEQIQEEIKAQEQAKVEEQEELEEIITRPIE